MIEIIRAEIARIEAAILAGETAPAGKESLPQRLTRLRAAERWESVQESRRCAASLSAR